MLEFLRALSWQRWGAWLRMLGLIFLVLATFLPLPAAGVGALLVPGLALFAFGVLAWLFRDDVPWRRRDSEGRH